MYFRNLNLFRFPKSSAEDLEGLAKRLKKHALRPCGPLEAQTRGWVSPFGRGEEGLLHEIGAFRLLTLGGEDKLLPPAVVHEAAADRIEALEAQRGRRVGEGSANGSRTRPCTSFCPAPSSNRAAWRGTWT